MLSQNFYKFGNKEIVKKLINKGLFDNHIKELSKALYPKRAFTKDIKCYFNNINNRVDKPNSNRKTNIESTTKYKNKYINKNNNNKKKFHGLSFDENRSKEDRFNKDMRKLLELLNNSQNETNKKFQELNKENNALNSLYRIYSVYMNKKKDNKDKDFNISMFLYDLLIKYKANKNLTFEINSLFSDVLKEYPLTINKIDKLKFYYIINGEKYNNIKKYHEKSTNKNETKINQLFAMNKSYNVDNSFNEKQKLPKEPTIIDMSKINYLKEIKYLKKLKKVAKKKIRLEKRSFGLKNHPNFLNLNLSLIEKKNNYIDDETNRKKLNESYEENKENTENENNKKKVKDINNKRKQLKFNILKDIKDINKLKKTIKDSLNSFEERHTNLFKTSRSQSIIDNTINKIKSNENTMNDLNMKLKINNDIKKRINETLFPIDIENNNKIIVKKRSILKPILNRSKFRKNTSFECFDEKMKEWFNRINHESNNNSFFSNKNVFQGSTFYSNKTINNLSKITLNNSINIPNKLNISPRKNVRISDNVVIQSKRNDNNKTVQGSKISRLLKKAKTIIEEDENKNNILRDNLKIKIGTEQIYDIAKKINMTNREQTINKINDYLKVKNSKLPLVYKGNKLKDTFFFLRKIKNAVKNNDVKYQFRHVRKMLNDTDRQTIKDIDLLESNIVNKDNELLIKTFKSKF